MHAVFRRGYADRVVIGRVLHQRMDAETALAEE
jgi:plasmid stabilization system protein ParE